LCSVQCSKRAAWIGLIRGVRIPTAGRRATIWIIPSSDRNAAPRYGSAHLLVPGIAGPEPAITEVDHAGVKHVRLVRTAISIERRIRPKMVAVSLGDRRWLAVSDDRLMPLVPNLLLGTLAVRSGSALRRRKRGTKRKRQSANQRSRGQSNCFHVQHIPAPSKPGYRTIAGTNNCQKTHSQSCAVTRSAEPVYTSGDLRDGCGRSRRSAHRGAGTIVPAVRFRIRDGNKTGTLCPDIAQMPPRNIPSLAALGKSGPREILRKRMIFRARDGGRDRDRTCDPYHVKVVLFR
jgi:hypothetical protein